MSTTVLAVDELHRVLQRAGIKVVGQWLSSSLANPGLGRVVAALARAEIWQAGGEAIRVADGGLHSVGFALLTEKFKQRYTKSLADAMILVPYMLYLGYRYAELDQLVNVLSEIIAPAIHLAVTKERPFVDEKTRNLCCLQLAVLYTECGFPGLARDIYGITSVDSALRSHSDHSWPRSQLIRGRAALAAVHEGGQSAASWLSRADELGVFETDRRAVATLQYTMATQEQTDQARRRSFTIMEEHYWPARATILNVIHLTSPFRTGLLHVYSAFYLGTIARMQAKAAYPDSEFKEDLHALTVCRGLGDEFRIDDKIVNASLPGSRGGQLAEFRSRSFRPLLSETNRQALAIFERLIRGG